MFLKSVPFIVVLLGCGFTICKGTESDEDDDSALYRIQSRITEIEQSIQDKSADLSSVDARLLVIEEALKGTFRAWSSWSECDATCGGGERLRTRTCMVPGTCVGNFNDTDTTRCNSYDCSATPIGWWDAFTTWTSFGECDVTCGGGVSVRTRMCTRWKTCIGFTREEKICNTQKCPDFFSPWSSWGQCSRSCDGGWATRQRSCMVPDGCAGNFSMIGECNTEKCPSRCELDGNFLYRDNCYVVPLPSYHVHMNYSVAVEECRKYGGSLAEIHDREHQKALADFVRSKRRIYNSYRGTSLWVGMRYDSKTSSLLFPSGKVMKADRLRWQLSYPSGDGENLILTIDWQAPASERSGMRNLSPLLDTFGVICQNGK